MIDRKTTYARYHAKRKKEQPLYLKSYNVRSCMKSRSDLPTPSAKEIEAWLQQQDFICEYTGVQLTHFDFSVDHKQPLARSGTNDLDNLCLCSKQSNTTKGSMTHSEFKSFLNLVEGWQDGGKAIQARLRMSGKSFKRR